MKTNLLAKSWIVTVPAAALGLAYLFVFFLPNQRAINHLSEQLGAKQAYVAQGSTMTTALESVRARLDRTQAYNTACEASTPGEAELSTVFAKINELADASGAAPTRFNPEPANRMDKFCRVPVVLGCTGSFPQIARLLCDLEKLSHAIWIDWLEFESTGEHGEAVQCELGLIVFADNPDDSDQVDLAE